jgi:hypothetical protein
LGNSIQREALPEEEALQMKTRRHATLQREAMPEEEEIKQSDRPDAAFQAGSISKVD